MKCYFSIMLGKKYYIPHAMPNLLLKYNYRKKIVELKNWVLDSLWHKKKSGLF